ncbi:MAG: NAD(P)H-dependent oxidoreductase [Gammaproteobacteria bacterium]|nr:NAD(P)H-dependent oxidoreductase [Gammaproteobacteria bacterium]
MKINRYVIISGSTRQESQSYKVSNYIATALSPNTSIQVDMIDLSVQCFPLWDEAIWQLGPAWHSEWKNISEKLKKADGIIFVVPEWNGMAPPQLMNFLQLCSNDELSHKPGLIVSVSSGQGGTYPIVELRISSHKNTKICYLPENIIVRDVKNVLNQFDVSESENDQYVRDRLHNALSILHIYASTFKKIRADDLIKNSRYPYGM